MNAFLSEMLGMLDFVLYIGNRPIFYICTVSRHYLHSITTLPTQHTTFIPTIEKDHNSKTKGNTLTDSFLTSST